MQERARWAIGAAIRWRLHFASFLFDKLVFLERQNVPSKIKLGLHCMDSMEPVSLTPIAVSWPFYDFGGCSSHDANSIFRHPYRTLGLL